MKGTSFEVLDWITHHHEYASLMQMSRQRLVGLRSRMRCGTFSERAQEALLEKLKNRMESLRSTEIGLFYGRLKPLHKVRDMYTLPAVVADHHGKFFCETTLLKMVKREEKMRDLNLDKVCAQFKCGYMPSKEIVREVLRRKGWNMIEERMVLPSVWEVG